MKILVVAAWEPELTRFRERVTLASAQDVVLDTLGVGIVEAAMGMTRCIARHAPDLAVLLGTAGALPGSGLAIGDVVSPTRVRLLDAGLLAKTAELPPPLPANATPDARVHEALARAGAKSVQIANTIGITTSDALAADLAASGCAVEHLEVFAFARACAVASVACGAVLGIANTVGSRGRGEWLANHVSASAAAADVAWRALSAGTLSQR